jgi:hypothetical protein
MEKVERKRCEAGVAFVLQFGRASFAKKTKCDSNLFFFAPLLEQQKY